MPHSIERSIKAAEVFLRMDGLSVTDACKRQCRKLLASEITLEQCLTHVTLSRGDG